MDQFIGEVRWLPFDFAPEGWAPCDGALISIAQNTALFSLLGTKFGGDGQRTFALPKIAANSDVNAYIAMQGRFPQRS